jgi:hypothetical protein
MFWQVIEEGEEGNGHSGSQSENEEGYKHHE